MTFLHCISPSHTSSESPSFEVLTSWKLECDDHVVAKWIMHNISSNRMNEKDGVNNDAVAGAANQDVAWKQNYHVLNRFRHFLDSLQFWILSFILFLRPEKTSKIFIFSFISLGKLKFWTWKCLNLEKSWKETRD